MKIYLILINLFLGILFCQCDISKRESNVDSPIEVTENDSLKMVPFDEYPGASEPLQEKK